MSRAAAAFGALILPGFALSFLLALGTRDWFHCFAHAEDAQPPALPSLFSQGEFLPVLLETLTPPFSSWQMAGLHFGPSALFAFFLWRARSPRAVKALLTGLALYLIWGLWILLPPSSQHDCAPEGMTTSLSLFLAVGSLAALLANKINCLTGACRT